MRVLFLTNSDVQAYGVCEALQGISTGLSQLGVHILVYSSDATAAAGHMPNGIRTIRGPLPTPRWLGGDVRELTALCQRERIDLIHCHNVYRPGWAARLVKRATGIPYVLTSHSDLNAAASPRLRRFWVKRRLRTILEGSAGITHFNEFMANNARRFASIDARSHIIPNGIDLAFWRQESHTSEAWLKGPYVFALGRLVPEKGFATLIDALAILKSRDIPLSLVLAGAGPDRERLVARAHAQGLTVIERPDGSGVMPAYSVALVGPVEGEQKFQLFAGAEVVAFPSHADSETFGLVALEALAAGKPLLASNIASVREMLGEGDTQLAPPEQPVAWADSLQRFRNDPDLRAALSRGNRKHAEQFSWDRIARQYLDVYREVLATRTALTPERGRRTY